MSFRIRRVKWREVLQSCAITKLILILSLNHGRPKSRKLNEKLECIYTKKKIIITANNLIKPQIPFPTRILMGILEEFLCHFCDSMNFLKNSDGNISSAVIVKEDGHGILEQFRIPFGKLAGFVYHHLKFLTRSVDLAWNKKLFPIP